MSLALVVAVHIAAGVVVDATGSVEARGTQSDPTAFIEGATAPDATGSLVLRPTIAAAAESEGAAAAVNFTPQFSLNTTSAVPTFLGDGDVRGQLPFGDRFSLRGFALGSAGTLDATSAQLAFATSSSALVDQLSALSFAGGSAGLGGSARFTRAFRLDVDASASGITRLDETSALARQLLPTTALGNVLATLSWDLLHTDAAVAIVDGRAATVEDLGELAGVTPSLGWRHAFARNTGVEVNAGLGGYRVVVARPADAPPAYLALATAHAIGSARFDLAGAAALDGSAVAGLDVVTDPLGALLEQRLGGGVDLAFRANRFISVHAASGAFAPVYAIGKPANTQLATLVLENRAAVAWSVFNGAALELSGLATTRFLNQDVAGTLQSVPHNDFTVGVSFVVTAPIFHSGGRPAGSDPRPGRDLGATEIGKAPPPGTTTIEAPEPLPTDEEEQEPPPAPVPLAVPPPNVPIMETPLKLDTLKRPSKADKKAADKKKKKDAAAKDNSGDEPVPNALEKAPSVDEKPAPAP